MRRQHTSRLGVLWNLNKRSFETLLLPGSITRSPNRPWQDPDEFALFWAALTPHQCDMKDRHAIADPTGPNGVPLSAVKLAFGACRRRAMPHKTKKRLTTILFCSVSRQKNSSPE